MTDAKERTATGKCPLWLLPEPPLEIVARVFQHGLDANPDRTPYGWRNAPIKASTYLSASRRHHAAWAEGEDLDRDSKLNHLAHDIATKLIMLDALLNGTLIDDRPQRAAAYIIRSPAPAIRS
jgi:hypothetical protein